MNSRNRPREASQKRLSLASDNVPNHRTLTQRPGCHLLLSGLSTTTSHHDHLALPTSQSDVFDSPDLDRGLALLRMRKQHASISSIQIVHL